MTTIDRHTFPPGGWAFIQPQTKWKAPTPTSSTFLQTVDLIIQHRLGNPSTCAKYKLSTDRTVVAAELENFTRQRLGLKSIPIPKSLPPPVRAGAAGAVVAVGGDGTVAGNILRAAQGTGVVLDWLQAGGAAVAQDLAEARAAICAGCPYNRPGAWYTVAPATLIKETLEARKDLTLLTSHDEKLQSCHICKCLMRLKVWVPISHIKAKTRPEIMREFPDFCWIAKEAK